MNAKTIFKFLFGNTSIEKKATDPHASNIKFIGSEKPILTLGDETYINGLIVYCWDPRIKVAIGKYCSLADNISIIAGGEHDKDWVSTFPFIEKWGLEDLKNKKKPRYKGDIKIGNDVWIANDVKILSGVSIGHGAVIGAGSIVTTDIPPYMVAAGNPARKIKMRFSQNVIDELLEIRWWDWEKARLKEGLVYLDDVERFIEFAKKKK